MTNNQTAYSRQFFSSLCAVRFCYICYFQVRMTVCLFACVFVCSVFCMFISDVHFSLFFWGGGGCLFVWVFVFCLCVRLLACLLVYALIIAETHFVYNSTKQRSNKANTYKGQMQCATLYCARVTVVVGTEVNNIFMCILQECMVI